MRIFENANEILEKVIRKFFYASMAIKLKQKANKCNGIKDYVELAFDFLSPFTFKPSYINPSQVEEEITELLAILAKNRPKFVLEIGTAQGGTLFLFTRVSSPDATIISIDLPSGRFGGGYPKWKIPFYESFGVYKQKIHLLRKDSHVFSTVDIVERILKGFKLDFLFIDGDHTYDGVKRDFEMYSRLVRKGGIIAFHDICPHPPDTGVEVNKFWREIKKQYRHEELIHDCAQGWAGIGLVHV
jgi:predicted O-methyltransferase YrrM